MLNKRKGYRRIQRLQSEKVARYYRIDKLTADPGIIRNRMKIAAGKNARASGGAGIRFDAYCWQFVDGQPRQNRWKTMRQIPATTLSPTAFSRDLSGGFSFVGSTVISAACRRSGWSATIS